MNKVQKSILIIVLILIVDQIVKISIKSNMLLYEEIHVLGRWFQIKFIENNGMAFGLDFPGKYGKIILSLFRIVTVIAIAFYMRYLIRIKSPFGLIIAMSLIMAGAIGNILDSAFYGMIFSESTQFSHAELFPENGGYSGFLRGKVVDLFYFPIIRGTWPEWVPLKGGDYFEFFRPVFNIADSCITTGVFMIIIFQKRFFKHMEK